MSATGEPVTRRKVFAGATALASTGAFLAAFSYARLARKPARQAMAH